MTHRRTIPKENLLTDKQWKQMTLVYPLARLDRVVDIWTLIFECQHFDRVDFDNFRARLRATIKKEHLIQFDRCASETRTYMYRQHYKARRNCEKTDLSTCIDQQLNFGAKLRLNLYYFDVFATPEYHKPKGAKACEKMYYDREQYVNFSLIE